MAFSIVTDTKKRYRQGNRFVVEFVADEVDNSGSYVAKADIGLATLDHVQATCKEDAVAVQAFENSQDGSAASSGDLYLKTASGTHDVHVRVVGR